MKTAEKKSEDRTALSETDFILFISQNDKFDLSKK